MKPKIYCFDNTGCGDIRDALAMAEDGHVLGRHCSSSRYFCQLDLGIYGLTIQSVEQVTAYHKHYPDGYQLVWVEDPRMSLDLEKAYELNQALKHEALTQLRMAQPAYRLWGVYAGVPHE